MTSGEGMYAVGSGYSDLVITRTADGPAIDGPVPHRIGVDRDALAQMVPALGTWDEPAGVLTVCGVRFRVIGADGTDIVVFERGPA